MRWPAMRQQFVGQAPVVAHAFLAGAFQNFSGRADLRLGQFQHRLLFGLAHGRASQPVIGEPAVGGGRNFPLRFNLSCQRFALHSARLFPFGQFLCHHAIGRYGKGLHQPLFGTFRAADHRCIEIRIDPLATRHHAQRARQPLRTDGVAHRLIQQHREIARSERPGPDHVERGLPAGDQRGFQLGNRLVQILDPAQGQRGIHVRAAAVPLAAIERIPVKQVGHPALREHVGFIGEMARRDQRAGAAGLALVDAHGLGIGHRDGQCRDRVARQVVAGQAFAQPVPSDQRVIGGSRLKKSGR